VTDPAALRGGAVADTIRRHRLVVVLRRVEPRERLLALVDELAEAGARIFEITFDAPDAAEDLAAVRGRLDALADGCVVGAGTLLSPEALDAAQGAGAEFGVAPISDPRLLKAAIGTGLPFVPGAFTPTEISAAWDAGATFVKLFPASALTPGFVRELSGPLPDVELIPTGGLDAERGAAFLAAGAVAVGIGGELVRADAETRCSMIATLGGRSGDESRK
jgi:2-dehydro-3-deoxyphosphogluconate aldolase/(4S)-4-hydroxy-2-oxoglutarate aldolase